MLQQDYITSTEFNFDNITLEYLQSLWSVEFELSNLQERAHQLWAKTEKDHVLREDVDSVDLRELQKSAGLCTDLIVVTGFFFRWILRIQANKSVIENGKTNIGPCEAEEGRR